MRPRPSRFAPDVQSQTTGASPRAQIVLCTVGAFAISYVAKLDRFDKRSVAVATLITGKGIVAWFALLISLSIMSDFETTQQLAQAFALLILLSALFINGPQALAVISREISKAQKPTEAKD